ncbi:OLC1v1033535C1 [Oldenlandia corymbosa var. corymbosa]|uniref:Pulmonary surfactant-associated protein B n=1 Tax=Oldenlandia corymbosa var. corymbosa TaxID=529605 RepID=A0AAV1CP84_OLDCO|nr:OLC1v1033535C1 [Oldenlandia corymbosa var. corymbosa]
MDSDDTIQQLGNNVGDKVLLESVPASCDGAPVLEEIRVEIDTSAPIESVKQAASRFGGMGFWRPNFKPQNPPDNIEATEIAELEEQAAQLEKDLVAKERETLDVLKELENTKMVVEELKAHLQKEGSEVYLDEAALGYKDDDVDAIDNNTGAGGFNVCLPSSAPGYILLELKQAKLNLTKTTDSLAAIRASVESYNRKIEKERISLEKTRQRLSSSVVKVSNLETELNQTKDKLELIKGGPGDDDLAKELQRLSAETEGFKKVGEAARAEVSRAVSEIEQAKIRIKTTEIRLVAAKKMKEAARAAEAVALAEIKAMSNSTDNPEVVTIGFDEYSSLVSRAQEAEAAQESKLADVMAQVDEANVSKDAILKKVEEATEEVKSSKRALEEALSRVENANRGKLAVEEALRKWRSERGQKRRPGSATQNTTKFKKDSSRLQIVNDDLSLANEEELLKTVPAVKPTISIGQILSRKLLLTEEFGKGGAMKNSGSIGKRKVSLAQMLGKHYAAAPGAGGGAENAKQQQQIPAAKRKKFGLARISLLAGRVPDASLPLSVSINLIRFLRMYFRVLVFVALLSINCCVTASNLETTNFIPTHSRIASALHNYDQLTLPDREAQSASELSKNDQVCVMCEQFTEQAVTYLANNKTQKEIIQMLHKSCSKIRNFKKQCITLVDYYAPLFFMEVSSIQPQDFCEKVDLCEKIVLISQQLSKNSCDLCHNVVTEAVLKLKDPDTQLEIIEVLLKACDSVQGYVKKCKRLVFEYAPVILINAEEFLETKDICSLLHACDAEALASAEAETETSSLHAAS